MPNLFEYFDYHKYLQDYYNEKKQSCSYFSFRYISQRTGTDPGYLVKVLQGKKNLSVSAVPKFAGLLKLSKRETEYFELLILFGRAKSNVEIANYFEKLLSYTAFKCTTLDAGKYEFYQKWYYTVVRELLGFYRFNGDYKALAAMTVPPIKASEAKKAVGLLLRLGLVEKNAEGGYTLTTRFLTTGEEWRSLAIRKFQEQTIELGRESLERIPKEDRDISTLTLSLSKSGFEAMREYAKQFRRQVLELAEKEQHAAGVYQLNVQLFPVSRRKEESTQ